jgi:pimeloyl-ACP methyl ester carboxylesterase
LRHPSLVSALALLGATAGIVDASERAERRRTDDTLADEIEATGVDAFLLKWLASPLFATLPDDASGLADRRQNTASGLASSLRQAGTGAQAPLWDRLAEIAVPILVMAGELDHKFSAIGRDLVTAIGANATFTAIAEAGHAAHLEQPAAVAAAIRALLQHNSLSG